VSGHYWRGGGGGIAKTASHGNESIKESLTRAGATGRPSLHVSFSPFPRPTHGIHTHTHARSLTREAKRFSSSFFCRLSSDPPCARLLAVRFRVPVTAPTDTFTAVVAVVVVVVVVAVVSVVVLEAQAGKEELKEWANP